MNTDIVLMHNTDMEREGGRHREMDFSDKAVFGQQMGETAAWAAEWRRREMSGRRGEEQYVGGGSEEKVFPELAK